MPESIQPTPADAGAKAEAEAKKNDAGTGKAAPTAPSSSPSASVPPVPPLPPKTKSGAGGGSSRNGAPAPKRGKAAYIWLLAGLAALGVAVAISLDEKPWRQAQETWQEWRRDLTSLIPGALPDTQEAQETQTAQEDSASAPEVSVTEVQEAQTTEVAPALEYNADQEQRLTLMEQQMRQLASASETALQRLDILAQQQNELRQGIGAHSPATPQVRQAALALGLLQLSLVSRNGAPFASEWRVLVSLLPGNADVAALAPLATHGVAAEATLLLQVPSLLDALAEHENAAPLREATAPFQWGVQGVWQWLKHQACGLVQIRRLDEGESGSLAADAFMASEGRAGILARMERAARVGNLRAVLAAATRLQGRDAQRAADWMHAARQRLELQTRIAALVEVVAATTEAESPQR